MSFRTLWSCSWNHWLFLSNFAFLAVKGKDVYPQNAPKSDGAKKEVNVNETRIHFHSDQGATDLIALLSLNKAKEGGESKWVSALAIHNELLRRGRKVRPFNLTSPYILFIYLSELETSKVH